MISVSTLPLFYLAAFWQFQPFSRPILAFLKVIIYVNNITGATILAHLSFNTVGRT